MRKTKSVDRVLGIMSGTSLDGVDYALCEISARQTKLVKLWSMKYPTFLKKRLMDAATDKVSSYEMGQLHHDLGRFYAKNAPSVKFDYIGLHGQTIFHNPFKPRATFQIGEPAYLAARFRVPVVNQFRTMDMALGGQGAPLATLFHKEVFSHPSMNVAVNNLGGISNVTFLPAPALRKKLPLLSFDTGPANILIDQAVFYFSKGKRDHDQDGNWAYKGIARVDLIKKWMAHPYFKIKPPKSTGREEFGEKYFLHVLRDCKNLRLSKEDALATFTDFTAQTIAMSYKKFLPLWPDMIVLVGGGARNHSLVKRIRRAVNELRWVEQLSNGVGGKMSVARSIEPIKVTTAEALGWSAHAIEGAAFALLAYRTMHGLSGNIPETTGARYSAVLGQVSPAP